VAKCKQSHTGHFLAPLLGLSGAPATERKTSAKKTATKKAATKKASAQQRAGAK
jgi:hypothetical protein